MYPLMLVYRLRHYSPSTRGVYLGYAAHEDRHSLKRRTLAQRFVDAAPELFSIVTTDRELDLAVAPGDKLSLAELAGELMRDAERAGVKRPVSDYELLASVIALGDVNGSYGSSYWSNETEVLHLLACGIEWDSYLGVDHISWREWGGTFAEDTYETKLGTTLKCRCDEWVQETFGLEPPSIAQLLSALGAGALGKVFNV